MSAPVHFDGRNCRPIYSVGRQSQPSVLVRVSRALLSLLLYVTVYRSRAHLRSVVANWVVGLDAVSRGGW